MDNYTLETLDVYNEAESFSDKIWDIVETWDGYRKDTIGKQLARAADSISANIAEGYRRYYYKESNSIFIHVALFRKPSLGCRNVCGERW